MKFNLYKIVEWLVCVLYVGVTYLGGMAVIFLSLLLYHNKNWQCTDFEFGLVVTLGGVIGVIVDYLAGKFNVVGK